MNYKRGEPIQYLSMGKWRGGVFVEAGVGIGWHRIINQFGMVQGISDTSLTKAVPVKRRLSPRISVAADMLAEEAFWCANNQELTTMDGKQPSNRTFDELMASLEAE